MWSLLGLFIGFAVALMPPKRGRRWGSDDDEDEGLI
jgi:hypothetical protein